MPAPCQQADGPQFVPHEHNEPLGSCQQPVGTYKVTKKAELGSWCCCMAKDETGGKEKLLHGASGAGEQAAPQGCAISVPEGFQKPAR